ncbi:gypsy retrotransposon integrase-like protein 1 [Astyanax mexicanus]|uniref:gypsy retrotransposon integrase-like protein 1 n=1 Tax=Astyanax mexicanus TaxID=7994 RepID=UPI0020CB47BC|nr:gypsy retrotransposon integrase-like protein 1 [Astyanax mexicanus]XP_049326183.1 gypsy retrotransposon integrase-like protein 1 [Astyanax mexicanus]
MLSVEEALPVAEEEEVVEVVESSSSRLGEIYSLVAEGCYPRAMNNIRKKNLKRYSQKFMVEDGRLYYVGQKKEEKREVVIEDERKRQIFLQCHFNEVGHHLGQKKTVQRIQSKYYWLGIVKDVVDWIKLCEPCQHAERNKNMARTVRPLKVDGPWEIMAVETVGPFLSTVPAGNTHVVIITDYFSKWVEAFPVQRSDALCVARCILSTIYRFGPAKTIFCSQSAGFCEEVSKFLCERWNMGQTVTAADPPRCNALYDRNSSLLKHAITQVVEEKQAEWDDFLDPVLSLFRTTVNPTTKFTPHCLMFNRKASIPAELDVMSCEQEPGSVSLSEEAERSFLSTVQEHQDKLKQTVISNMNSAYKEEKKNAKQRSKNMSSTTLTVTEPLCSSDEPPSPKKLKEELFLTFPVETVLSAVQTVQTVPTLQTVQTVPDEA